MSKSLGKNGDESHETSTGLNMSKRENLKGERVFIKDSVEGAAGTQLGTKRQPSGDHTSPSQANASPSVAVQSDNTRIHVAARSATMETSVDKHRGISQRQCHDSSGLAEMISGYFVNRTNVSEDGMSHTSSADLLATPASSRESILSEGSDGGKSWSTAQLSCVTSPASFRRMLSPCSSVCSGIFSPAVVQVKRHFLAPGSSLVNTPAFSSCESLSSSVSAQSPPPRPPRHRPPLTRLSLLTAILRKGRLPVLSSAFQRPYTPCWPVNPVTLSFCNACTAASSVSSIPLDFSSQFSSSASLDSQSHVNHREPDRCATAPPHVQSNELGRTFPQSRVKRGSEQICSSSVPQSEQVISPPSPPRAPPLFGSNFTSVFPATHGEMDYTISKKLQRTHKSPELKPVNADLHLKGPADNDLKNLIPETTRATYEQGTSALHPPNSSLTRLHSLSQQLRSPPTVRPLLPEPSQPHSSGATVFCDMASSPELNTTGRCESGRSCPGSKSTSALAGLHKAHCLSPSRYTQIAFPGWPSPTSSPAPTPSPAPPIRDLTPSPSLSVRSTSSPRPGSGISDWSDGEGKKRKTHRIKLSYKSLAAIPTNTLLLDQQAIDEHVERGQSPCDSLDRCHTFDRGVADTHAKMCSPAELRQQSEELYAVIDDIMANSNPTSKSPQPSSSLDTRVGLQNSSLLTKSLGRETKYASVGSLHPTTGVERKLMNPKKTKPGVIRPMAAMLTAEDKTELNSSAFPQFVVKQALADSKKVEGNRLQAAREGRYNSSKRQTFGDERKPERRDPLSVFDLQITEPDYH
ncbi:muscular LMNA-interacting protein isoform X2 [Pungitius pungitius]|uniref:muscular LMNA-interacting protein isoform X2 n=1 Tax=Pungitius pungitius TaxID=134920 RepID=UPI002E130BBB